MTSLKINEMDFKLILSPYVMSSAKCGILIVILPIVIQVRYEDGDVEELTIKEIRKTLVTEEGQSTPTKTRAQPTSPGKTAEESPAKKQKVATPKKADTKTQSPAG